MPDGIDRSLNIVTLMRYLPSWLNMGSGAYLFSVFFICSAELAALSGIRVYDRAGNTVLQQRANDLQSLVFNSQNRIVQSSGNKGMGIYTFADDGARLRKRVSVLRAAGRLAGNMELSNAGRFLTLETRLTSAGLVQGHVNHIYLNGVRIAVLAPTSEGNPAIRYYLTDQVSSVKAIVGGTGQILSRHEYLPYGEEFGTPNPELSPAAKFNSQEPDAESGLDFFNARHYDAELARFINADTVVDGDVSTIGWNRYLYARGNPIKYSDPTGRWVLIGIVNNESHGNHAFAVINGLIYENDRDRSSRGVSFKTSDTAKWIGDTPYTFVKINLPRRQEHELKRALKRDTRTSWNRTDNNCVDYLVRYLAEFSPHLKTAYRLKQLHSERIGTSPRLLLAHFKTAAEAKPRKYQIYESETYDQVLQAFGMEQKAASAATRSRLRLFSAQTGPADGSSADIESDSENETKRQNLELLKEYGYVKTLQRPVRR
jgi:RHS repeat-associated protein